MAPILVPRSLSPEERDAVGFIWAFPMDGVKETLRAKGWIAPERADEAVDELRRWFILIRLGYSPLSMFDNAIDQAWHAFILHTRDYHSFCSRAFGQYVHHSPNTKARNGAPGEQLEDDGPEPTFRDTVAAYREVFGPMPKIWIQPPTYPGAIDVQRSEQEPLVVGAAGPGLRPREAGQGLPRRDGAQPQGDAQA